MTALPPPPPPGTPAPGFPPPPAPPARRGVPVWGWVLIGVGGAGLLGLIAVVVVIVVAITTLRPTPVDPIAVPTSSPPAPTSIPGETLEPGDGRFSLDTRAPAAMGPFWGIPGDLMTEWETVVFDVDGLNHFRNAELGCDFRSYQAVGAGDPSGATDRLASEEQMDVLADVWLSPGVVNVERTAQPTVWIPLDGSSEIELLVDRIDSVYESNGVATTTYVLGREFLDSGGALAARLECRSDVMDSPDSPLGWIVDGLSAVTF